MRPRRLCNLTERVRPAKVWIAASTMADERVDEDDAVIAAWRNMRERLPDAGAAQAGALRCRWPANWTPRASAMCGGRGSVRTGCGRSSAACCCWIPSVNSAVIRAGGLRLHGRYAGGARRPQYSRAGALRQARDRRPAHGEFPGHRGRVSCGARDGGDRRAGGTRGGGGAACWRTMAGSARAPASAPRRAAGLRRAPWRPMREIYRVPRYRPAMPWYLVAWALARVWRREASAAGRRVLCAPPQAARARDQRRQSDYGRNRKDALRAAPGGIAARTRPQARAY